jgi:acetylornithine deacetylase/succinyl-diaminopimelate desuccinylase-like protein
MPSFSYFKECAKKVLSIPSHEESGNDELVLYLRALLTEFGFKTQVQPVGHSVERLSKRQSNLIAFSSDTLVDRSTRNGVLFINPLDTTIGSVPSQWTLTHGNPHTSVSDEKIIVGAGTVQGKLDFLCRVFGASQLPKRSHKTPIYLVGACASQFGMLGSKYVVESLCVNPKSVYTYAPTGLLQTNQSPGQISFQIEIDAAGKERDSKGYNRCVEITTTGLSLDLSQKNEALNSFDLLMNLLLDATDAGFDFQWGSLMVDGAEGAIPDLSKVKIYLTTFQFEDFKQFIKNALGNSAMEKNFRVEYSNASDAGAGFIPQQLLEVILRLDYEWKKFIEKLNQNPNPTFDQPYSQGTISRIQMKNPGRISLTFELRSMPNLVIPTIEKEWKEIVSKASSEYPRMHFQVTKNYAIQGALSEFVMSSKNINYLNDAGFFTKAKFPTSIVGLGSMSGHPKGPNEQVSWNELEKAIAYYQDLISAMSS